MSDLLAIDPSIRSPGAALFRDGKLIAAARIKFKSDTSRNQAVRCMMAADAIASWVTSVDGHPDILVYEWPQIYTAAKSKGDPNSLLAMVGVDLALTAGYTIAAGMRRVQLETFCYKPSEWIGQLPKATNGKASASPRAKRIHSRLSPDELAVVPDQHDAIDAVGLGLHHLGRLGVRHVYTAG